MNEYFQYWWKSHLKLKINRHHFWLSIGSKRLYPDSRVCFYAKIKEKKYVYIDFDFLQNVSISNGKRISPSNHSKSNKYVLFDVLKMWLPSNETIAKRNAKLLTNSTLPQKKSDKFQTISLDIYFILIFHICFIFFYQFCQ